MLISDRYTDTAGALRSQHNLNFCLDASANDNGATVYVFVSHVASSLLEHSGACLHAVRKRMAKLSDCATPVRRPYPPSLLAATRLSSAVSSPACHPPPPFPSVLRFRRRRHLVFSVRVQPLIAGLHELWPRNVVVPLPVLGQVGIHLLFVNRKSPRTGSKFLVSFSSAEELNFGDRATCISWTP